jgi:hypothetical protein
MLSVFDGIRSSLSLLKSRSKFSFLILTVFDRISAKRYDEYRDSLIEHLLKKTIKHWDVDVRNLGAKSLREIIGRNLESLGPPLVPRIVGGNMFFRQGCLTTFCYLGIKYGK